MSDRWGHDGSGPGGDPSWLGGKDREGGSQGSGGWSSGFADGARSPDPDFGGGDVGGGRGAQAAERMAPRFGDSAGDDARTTGEGSPWLESFTSQSGEGSRDRRWGFSRVMGLVVPILMLGFVVIFFTGLFGDGGFGGFGSWWILLFVAIPMLGRLIRMIRRHLDD